MVVTVRDALVVTVLLGDCAVVLIVLDVVTFERPASERFWSELKVLVKVREKLLVRGFESSPKPRKLWALLLRPENIKVVIKVSARSLFIFIKFSPRNV